MKCKDCKYLRYENFIDESGYIALRYVCKRPWYSECYKKWIKSIQQTSIDNTCMFSDGGVLNGTNKAN